MRDIDDDTLNQIVDAVMEADKPALLNILNKIDQNAHLRGRQEAEQQMRSALSAAGIGLPTRRP